MIYCSKSKGDHVMSILPPIKNDTDGVPIPRTVGFFRSLCEPNTTAEEAAHIFESYNCDILIRDNQPDENLYEFIDYLARHMEPGDCLIVKSMDHIANSTSGLACMIEKYRVRDISIKILDLNLCTSKAKGIRFLTDLWAIIEFEKRSQNRKQGAGIQRAKREGKYKGRKRTKPVIVQAVLCDISSGALTKEQIAIKYGISISTVYRIQRDRREIGPMSVDANFDENLGL
jgi:DNA-binding NarL/FixJ family response regulator